MGNPIPEPSSKKEYSGKFVLRVPKSLHRKLASLAEEEGVSLNHLLNTLLVEMVGRASASPSLKKINSDAFIHAWENIEPTAH